MKNSQEKYFEVTPFRPEDAEGIARLFLSVYGTHYPVQYFYDPQAIIKANQEGSTYSIVARSMSGDVIGVTHLYKSSPYADLYEWGAGLVLQEYRNAGVNKELAIFLHREFIYGKPHIEGLFGEAVCNHTHLQKAISLFGYIETAIEVALMPAEAFDKEKSATGRVATLDGFRCCRPKPHLIYLPAPYERELRAIYARLDDRRDMAVSKASVPGDFVSKAELSVFDFAQVARIVVPEVSADFVARFSELEKEAISRNAVVVQAWLDLTQPCVGEVVEVLRRSGYFFGGIIPRWFDGDGILMQKLFCPPDFESIHLLADFSKQLLGVIMRDWQRAST
jgi:hypothetical protein